MKKKFFRVGKRVVAVSMAAAMVASIIPDMGIVAKAAVPHGQEKMRLSSMQ